MPDDDAQHGTQHSMTENESQHGSDDFAPIHGACLQRRIREGKGPAACPKITLPAKAGGEIVADVPWADGR
jgi:hypothetical protein